MSSNRTIVLAVRSALTAAVVLAPPLSGLAGDSIEEQMAALCQVWQAGVECAALAPRQPDLLDEGAPTTPVVAPTVAEMRPNATLVGSFLNNSAEQNRANTLASQPTSSIFHAVTSAELHPRHPPHDPDLHGDDGVGAAAFQFPAFQIGAFQGGMSADVSSPLSDA